MTIGSKRKTLQGIALFGALAASDREALERRCHWREVAAGEQIIEQGEISSDIFFVIEGKFRVVLYATTGKNVALGDIGPGEMFGEYSAIDHAPRSATIEASQPGLLAIVSSTVFEEIVTAHPTVALRLIRHLLAEVRTLTSRVFEFSTLAAANRLHAELFRLAQAAGPKANTALIDPAPTHADLASQISTHREGVTRELNRLVQIGLLERQDGVLCITDLTRLARMVSETRSE